MRLALSAMAASAVMLLLIPQVSQGATPPAGAAPDIPGRALVLPVRGGRDGGPGGGHDFGRGGFGGRDFAGREFDGERRDGFRPPPPPPPLPPLRGERLAPPPPYLPPVGAYRDRVDDESDDPGKFVPPPWLQDWIATARQRGYSDAELATVLERHPRIERFVARSRRQGLGDQAIFATLGLDLRSTRPTLASIAPPPPLPAPKSVVPQPPVPSTVRLEVPDSLQTTDLEVELAGKVTGTIKGSTVFVDGAQVKLGKDGSFRYRRGVPLGETEIKVEARDRQGRATEAMVTVTRDPLPASASAYEPLNPGRAKGKRNPKAVALVIGVDRYESAPRAEFAENDANAFYDYATQAMGVPHDRVKLLTGEKARRLSVEKAVLAWVQPLIAQGKSDVYLFFSGHGLASDDGRDQYLLPYDGDRMLLAQSALKRKDIIDALVAAGARTVTLFLDTCYSGGTRSNDTLVQAARPILISVKEGDLPANVTILAAAGRDQLSSSLAATRHGLFSYYLMKGLEGDAANGGRAITIGALESYLLQQVPAEAAKLGRSQYPELIGDESRVLSEW